MGKWEKLDDIKSLEIGNTAIRHYTRFMQGYESHIFWVFLKDEKELKEKWKLVSSIIALEIQTKVTLSIERSNFYICYIVEKNVEIQTKREIEYDPFCAKKYVIDSKIDLFEEKSSVRRYLENKLFAIASIEERLDFDKTVHIKKICLQNFRGFKGKAELDLQATNGKAASFVLIYAPNGCGKTSIFDGIEYALKGKVDYLLETKRISNFQGIIYHNRDNCLQEAFVELSLDNGKKILRKVKSVENENDDDSRIRRVSKEVRDIVGVANEADKWNGILLPYAKIENFISARKPEERYIEWFRNAPDLKEKQEEFEQESRKFKEFLGKLKKIEDNIKKITDELIKMENVPNALNTINRLIEQFNQEYIALGLEKGTIEQLKKEDEVQAYDLLRNQCKILERELEEKQKRVVFQSHLLERFLEENPILLRKKRDRGEEIKKEIADTQKIISDFSIYETKQEELKGFNEKIKYLNQKIEPYNEIIQYGKEKVENYCIERSKLCEKKKILEIQYKDFIKDENNEKNKKSDLIAQIQQKGILLEIRENIENLTDEVSELDKWLMNLQSMIGENQVEIRSYEEKITELQKEMKGHDLLQLSEKIESYNSDDYLKCKKLLGNNKATELQQIVKDYRRCVEEAKQMNSVCNQADNVLVELKKMGMEFQILHKKNHICPLCHTKFQTSEELNERIIKTSSMTNELKASCREWGAYERIYKNDYKTICNEVLEVIKKRKEELNQKISDFSEKKMNATFILNQNHQRVCEEKEKREHVLKKLEEKGYDHFEIGYSKEQINNYFNDVLIQKKNLEDKLNVCNNQINFLNKKISDIINKESECNQLLANLPQHDAMIRMAKFLDALEDDFEQTYQELKEKKDSIATEREKCLSIIEKVAYSDYHDITVKKDYLQHLLDEQKYIKSILKEYREILDCDVVEVGNRKQYLEEKDRRINYLIEILRQICEENGARVYYESYKKKNKELRELKSQEKKMKETIKTQQEKVKQITENLQKELAEYFGQSSMDVIYQKIDAHDIMKHLRYELSFNDNQKGELIIHALENMDSKTTNSDYRPEIYFSTAQLNTVAFSSFFSRALNTYSKLPIQSIFIDDPIGSYDDMNVLGFADLIRCLLENTKCQIVMSTHDETVFKILKRKLDKKYYSSCFIELPYGDGIKREV